MQRSQVLAELLGVVRYIALLNESFAGGYID
jgi:hypothetical protein